MVDPPADVQQAIRRLTENDVIRTHSANCWHWHLPCAALYAVARLDESEREIRRLRTLLYREDGRDNSAKPWNWDHGYDDTLIDVPDGPDESECY